MPSSFDWDLFVRRPLVGILRGFTSDEALHAARAAADGGLTTVEVTLNSEGAGEQIQLLKSGLGDRVNVGAGTVCSVDDVRVAIDSGATFIVTPVVDAEVIQICRDAELPICVGAMTPTEILQAWRLGATIVKVFPADSLGPAYLHSVRGPLSQIRLMPTGGVTVKNLADYHRAGAVAFGIGSPLFDRRRVAAGDWEWIRTQAGQFAETFETSAAVVGYDPQALKQSLADRVS